MATNTNNFHTSHSQNFAQTVDSSSLFTMHAFVLTNMTQPPVMSKLRSQPARSQRQNILAQLNKYKYPMDIRKMFSPSYFTLHTFIFMLKHEHNHPPGWLESNIYKSSLLPFIYSPSPLVTL